MSWRCHTFPTDHLDRSPLNIESQNIYDIFVTQDTFQLEMSPLKSEFWNIFSIFKTFPTFHFDMSPLKYELQNIYDIFVTLLTFQLEMSPLNFEPLNIPAIFFAFLTFHSDMFPSKSFNVETENKYEKFVMQETSISFKLQKKPYSLMWLSMQSISSPFVFGLYLYRDSPASLVLVTGLIASFSLIY